MWTGCAGPEWAWPFRPLAAISRIELLPQRREEGEHSEQIGIDGSCERPNSHQVVQAISSTPNKTVLGKSFLGPGLLCRYRRAKCRNDPKIRKASREERSTRRTVDHRATIKTSRCGATKACPLRRLATSPLWGMYSKPRPLGGVFYLRLPPPSPMELLTKICHLSAIFRT